MCSKDGIDSLLDAYPPEHLRECALAFAAVGAEEISAVMMQIANGLPARDEAVLSHANDMIADGHGYEWEAVGVVIARRLGIQV